MQSCRSLFGLLLFAVMAAAGAQEVHKRGDFQFETGPVPAYVKDTAVPEAWDADAPGAQDPRWRYWRFQIQSDRRAGHDAVYVEHVFEPRASSQLSEAGRFQMSFNPDYQRLVIHRVDLRRAGRWQHRFRPEMVSLARRETGFENNMADGTVTALIVLDDVRVGDVLRIAYSVIGSNPVLAGQVTDSTRLAWTSPVLESRLRVLFDPGTEPVFHLENGAPAPALHHGPEAVELDLQRHASASVVVEDDYPAWFQPYPLAEMGARRTWSDVVTWGLPLYPKVDSLSEDLRAQLVQWNALPDARARVTAALRLVQDRVRYFGVEMGQNSHRPTAPEETWRRQYGDCKDKAYLLTSLLQHMGVDAVPALVSVDRGRAVGDQIPSASAFDHVIVRVRLDGTTLWLDPTLTGQGGDPADKDLSSYGLVLPLAPGVSSLEAVRAPVRTMRAITVQERYRIPEGGQGVELSIDTDYRGSAADWARRSIVTERGEELQRRYAEYYRRRFGELEVVRPMSVEDDRDANSVILHEGYLLKSPLIQESGSLRALDIYPESIHSVTKLPASMARQGPLSIAPPGQYRHKVQVDFPADWKPAFQGGDAHFSASAFDYRREVRVEPGSATLSYAIQVNKPEVTAAEAGGYLEQMRLAGDDLSMRLRFMPAMAGKDREQRIRDLLRARNDAQGDGR